MYYYLFEPKGSAIDPKRRRVQHLLTLHGIAGEMATPSSSQSLEDLVTRAADKGFNTIVAVGGDHFITSVAKLLARSGLALGAIPVEASERMHTLLGVKDIDQAVLSLKQRKVSDVGVGVIAPGKVFLLDAEVAAERSTPIVVESKHYRVEGSFTQLTIERQELATVRFWDTHRGSSRLRQFAKWLIGRSNKDDTETVLSAPTLSITTPDTLPILVEGQQIAKTPCKVRVVPNALKLISARATLERP